MDPIELAAMLSLNHFYFTVFRILFLLSRKLKYGIALSSFFGWNLGDIQLNQSLHSCIFNSKVVNYRVGLFLIVRIKT